MLKLTLDDNPKYKVYYYLDSRTYPFKMVFKEKDIYTEIILTPKSIIPVNNVFLNTLFNLLNENAFKNVERPLIVLINIFSERTWFTLGKSFMFREDIDINDFISYFSESLFSLKNKAYPLSSVEEVRVKVFSLKNKDEK